ncbi:PEP-CTERM sorting domain-containing protein, partial [bacterium]|nr:PEP-CTERM sorting domain-containing protein [bacterium]
ITYDEENNRLLSFADEGGAGIALYSFTLDGTMTKLLTGLSLPHHIDPFSGGYAYTLYLNAESSSAVPEPATLLLMTMSGIGLLVKRSMR